MYGMTLLPYKNELIKDSLKSKVDDLKNNKTFRNSLNNHRDSELKVNERYNMIMKLVGELV